MAYKNGFSWFLLGLNNYRFEKEQFKVQAE
jgi:hypothetical protein